MTGRDKHPSLGAPTPEADAGQPAAGSPASPGATPEAPVVAPDVASSRQGSKSDVLPDYAPGAGGAVPAPAAGPMVAIGWMLVTGALFVGVTAIVKHVGSALPAAEQAFLRYVLGFGFLLPMLRPMIAARPRGRLLAVFLARGAVHTLGVILWFYAMTRITIAEVTAMNYLNPVYVTIGAALFLGERLAGRRIAAVAAAFLGMLIILRPGFRELDPGHFAMLGTAAFFGISYLMAKHLSGLASPAAIVGMMSVTVAVGLAPFAWAVWVPPTWTQIGWLFLVATFATAGHYTMTLAFRAAPVTVTQPVTFLQLVWAVLLGWTVFGETPDGWVLLGGVVIVGSVSFIAWREHVARHDRGRTAMAGSRAGDTPEAAAKDAPAA